MKLENLELKTKKEIVVNKYRMAATSTIDNFEIVDKNVR